MLELEWDSDCISQPGFARSKMSTRYVLNIARLIAHFRTFITEHYGEDRSI
jgi:hypothetical protein